jgi:dynein heavy chain
LRVSNTQPPKFYDEGINAQDYQVAYFMKKRWDVPVTAANLEECVLFRAVGTDPLEDLLEKMNTEYVAKLLRENDWPDGVKKEFIASLHRFMAFLNETTHAARGQTYLYIPDEDLTDIEAAAKDKDLLQRLESTVIYWTRQIKELVSNQDSPTNHAIESPLDEIAYWTRRSNNLVVLTQRLQKPKLKKIIKVLEQASSSYLPGFQTLEKKIQDGSAEAHNNLQFLNLLAEPCRKIEGAKPKDIPGILPEVLNNVRIIWELSGHYNTPERMKGLLTKISNQIIKRCRARINKDDMLDGDVEKCM